MPFCHFQNCTWIHGAFTACVLCSLAGYAPCLAAAKKLHAAGLLKEEVPGKVGGPPGNTFELVYGPTVRDKIWAKLYSVDAVLADWIRCVLFLTFLTLWHCPCLWSSYTLCATRSGPSSTLWMLYLLTGSGVLHFCFTPWGCLARGSVNTKRGGGQRQQLAAAQTFPSG
jgi:hypothetical protein